MPSNRWLICIAVAALAGCGSRSAPQPAAATAAEPGAGPATPAAAPAAASPAGFDRSLVWQGASFRVSSPNDSSLSQVRIEISGAAQPVEAISNEVDGTVVGAAIADLDGNGAPEIYVFASSAGSGSYGSVLAYAFDPGRPPVQIALPELAPGSAAAAGYMGHDEFSIEGSVLRRRFPVYAPGDSNAAPSGRTRQIDYRLGAGDAERELLPGPASES